RQRTHRGRFRRVRPRRRARRYPGSREIHGGGDAYESCLAERHHVPFQSCDIHFRSVVVAAADDGLLKRSHIPEHVSCVYDALAKHETARAGPSPELAAYPVASLIDVDWETSQAVALNEFLASAAIGT